jgi:glucokinase
MSSTSMRNPRPRDASPKSERPSRRTTDELTLGIDLGATKVVALLLDRGGKVVRHSGRLPHANDGPDRVIEVLLRAARKCGREADLRPASVGISVAAQVDRATGEVLHAPNLGWRNVNLGARLARALGVGVHVLNDGRAAAFAEWTMGAGIGSTELFYLALGTGVGGSAVSGGRLVEGGSNAAGEVGHVSIVSGGRRCHCPNTGCFEAYVGGWGVAERAREAVQANPPAGRPLVLRAGSVGAIRAETVFALCRERDPLARALVRETERYLGDGAVSVVNAFNPSLLVLGGGMVTGRPQFVAVVRAAVRSRCQPPAATVRVVRARFGEDAPAIGAAAWARDRTSPRLGGWSGRGGR